MSKSSNKLWKKVNVLFCHFTNNPLEPTDEPARVASSRASSQSASTEQTAPAETAKPLPELAAPPSQALVIPSQVIPSQPAEESVQISRVLEKSSRVGAREDHSFLTATMQRLSSTTITKSHGYQIAPESPSSYFGGSTHTRHRSMNLSSLRGKSGGERTTIVGDTAIALKRKSASALGAGISDTADSVNFIRLVEWIRTERLQTLPHKGSKWDTVLIRALYFAERLHGFETALAGRAVDIEQASQLGYGHIRLLLEVCCIWLCLLNLVLTE